MTDYATDNTTPAAPTGPSLTEVPWFPRPPMEWGPEMTSHAAPETPASGGGPTTPRSNVGLVFPR